MGDELLVQCHVFGWQGAEQMGRSEQPMIVPHVRKIRHGGSRMQKCSKKRNGATGVAEGRGP
eukprot:6388977-Pyramimonas_sp.AAC.1